MGSLLATALAFLPPFLPLALPGFLPPFFPLALPGFLPLAPFLPLALPGFLPAAALASASLASASSYSQHRRAHGQPVLYCQSGVYNLQPERVYSHAGVERQSIRLLHQALTTLLQHRCGHWRRRPLI